VEIDPVTQLPKGFNEKIIFAEPTRLPSDRELNSGEGLLSPANAALAETKFHARILLDRLGVAFAVDYQLEISALRGLFRVHLDLLALSNVKLKIFFRNRHLDADYH
jgi:hypothetical protein